MFFCWPRGYQGNKLCQNCAKGHFKENCLISEDQKDVGCRECRDCQQHRTREELVSIAEACFSCGVGESSVLVTDYAITFTGWGQGRKRKEGENMGFLFISKIY